MLKLRYISFSAALFISIFCANANSQESFPFVAEIKENSVNIRAGQSSNFEKLISLDKGDIVIVRDKKYSWYQIELPSDAKSYISSDFVEKIGDKLGVVTGDDVNVRAGKSTRRTVLSELNKDDNVMILEESKGWYKIQPIFGSSGWVKEDFVKFISKDVRSYRKKQFGMVEEKVVAKAKPKNIVAKFEYVDKPKVEKKELVEENKVVSNAVMKKKVAKVEKKSQTIAMAKKNEQDEIDKVRQRLAQRQKAIDLARKLQEEKKREQQVLLQKKQEEERKQKELEVKRKADLKKKKRQQEAEKKAEDERKMRQEAEKKKMELEREKQKEEAKRKAAIAEKKRQAKAQKEAERQKRKAEKEKQKAEAKRVKEQKRKARAKQLAEEEKRREELKLKAEQERLKAKKLAVQKRKAKLPKVGRDGSVKVTGKLTLQKNKAFKRVQYKVDIDEDVYYLIEGFKYIFDEFLNYNVTVEGVVNKTLQEKYNKPVVTVTKIELVL